MRPRSTETLASISAAMASLGEGRGEGVEWAAKGARQAMTVKRKKLNLIEKPLCPFGRNPWYTGWQPRVQFASCELSDVLQHVHRPQGKPAAASPANSR
jgi:hypothetical protein